MKQFTIFCITLFSFSFINAQTIYDALRYSTIEVGGTARTTGIGGGIGALGADFSVVSTNPAGLAAYRKSEFMFTPTIVLGNTDSELLNGGNGVLNRTKNRFNLNNFGLVIASRPQYSGWKTVNFSFGINKVANFHEQFFYEGTTEGSIVDRFRDLADGNFPSELDNFEAGLAFDAFAIFNDQSDETLYFNDFFPGEQVQKSQLVTRKGHINEMTISLAGNYREKLMYGGTIGIPLVTYEENRTYTESDNLNNNDVFNELEFKEKLTTSGAGINLKLGVIYRMSQMVRFGLAAHTPTSYRLEDNFTTEMTYNFNNPANNWVLETGSATSPELLFEYKVRSPWRFIGSAGILLNKLGFITLEAEYLDYSGAKFVFNNTDDPGDLAYERELNDSISLQFTSAVNLRLGGELAYKSFRFRGGFTLNGTPLANESATSSALSLGAGVRGKKVYLDLAYRRVLNEYNYRPYATFDNPELNVQNKRLRNKYMLTLGFKF